MIKVTEEMLNVVDDYNSKARTMTDTELVKRIIELHEANKPKPEPFGYFKAEPFGWTDCDKDDEGAVAMYEAPPTRKPLSEIEINNIVEEVLPSGTMLDFIRAIEQAHGIGVPSDRP